MEKESRIASDASECARKQHQAHNIRSTVFASSDTSSDNNNNIRGGKMCSGRPSTASGIFGGGNQALLLRTVREIWLSYVRHEVLVQSEHERC